MTLVAIAALLAIGTYAIRSASQGLVAQIGLAIILGARLATSSIAPRLGT